VASLAEIPRKSRIRISIISAAFEAIAATLPLGSVGFEPELDAKGERMIWLEPAVVATSTITTMIAGPLSGRPRQRELSSPGSPSF